MTGLNSVDPDHMFSKEQSNGYSVRETNFAIFSLAVSKKTSRDCHSPVGGGGSGGGVM